jgi:hypothetical protein
MEESQGQIEEAHFPEQMRKHSKSNRTNQSIHARMAELLRNCGYEEEHRGNEWMAVSKDTNVYQETVETAEDKEAEAVRTRFAGMGGL